MLFPRKRVLRLRLTRSRPAPMIVERLHHPVYITALARVQGTAPQDASESLVASQHDLHVFQTFAHGEAAVCRRASTCSAMS